MFSYWQCLLYLIETVGVRHTLLQQGNPPEADKHAPLLMRTGRACPVIGDLSLQGKCEILCLNIMLPLLLYMEFFFSCIFNNTKVLALFHYFLPNTINRLYIRERCKNIQSIDFSDKITNINRLLRRFATSQRHIITIN